MENATSDTKEAVTKRASSEYLVSLFLRTSDSNKIHALKRELVNTQILGEGKYPKTVGEGSLNILNKCVIVDANRPFPTSWDKSGVAFMVTE